jgi:hypothetical protein
MRLTKPTKAQERKWRRWVQSLPDPKARETGEKVDPWTLYRIKSTGQRATLTSIFADGTLSMAVSGEFNAVLFARTVFGVPLDDIEECGLPDPSEPVGVALTEQEVKDNLDALRAIGRPDLWKLDGKGNAIRKH